MEGQNFIPAVEEHLTLELGWLVPLEIEVLVHDQEVEE